MRIGIKKDNVHDEVVGSTLTHVELTRYRYEPSRRRKSTTTGQEKSRSNVDCDHEKALLDSSISYAPRFGKCPWGVLLEPFVFVSAVDEVRIIRKLVHN